MSESLRLAYFTNAVHAIEYVFYDISELTKELP